MAALSFIETVEKCYLAYYGRSSDIDGLAYWATRLDQVSGNLSEIIEAFANSPESQSLYGGLENSAKINKIYQQIFGRDADSVGLEYYSKQLSSGNMSQGSIALDILNGAQGSDLLLIESVVTSTVESLDATLFQSLVEEYSSPIPDNLAGEYSLRSFELYYDSGAHVDSSTIDLDGFFNISQSGSFYQEISINGQMATSVGSFQHLDEDTLLLTSGEDSYYLGYEVSNDILTTIGDTHQFGGDYVEYDHWQYMT